MARLLMAALANAGFDVTLVSTLRSYRKEPDLDALRAEAAGERERICSLFRA